MKACNYGGGTCPAAAIEGGAGRCELHAPKARATREELQQHYRGPGSKHRTNRILAFHRDGWTCRRCGWKPRIVREYFRFPDALAFPPEAAILAEMTREYKRNANHLEAHHIVDVEAAPELANDLANLETICRDCHSIETGKRRGDRV